MTPEPNKMTKEDFLEIFSEDITVRRQKEIRSLITKRFEYIMTRLFELNGITDVNWYDFDNEDEEGGGDGGFFDPRSYSSETSFTGDWSERGQLVSDELENNDFPNRWYYEDFEDEIAKALKEKRDKVERDRLRDLQKTEERKRKASEVKQRIREKLTPEELSYIKFK